MNDSSQFAPLAAAISSALCGGAISRRISKLLYRFRDKGATNLEHAETLQALGENRSWIFDRLARGGVFVEVPDGRYYLDEKAAYHRRRRRQIIGCAILGIVFLIILVLWSSGVVRL